MADHGRVVKDKATEAKRIAAKEIKDAADKKADEEKAAEKAAAKAAKAAAHGDEDEEEEEEEDSRGGWSGDVEVAAVMMCACDDGWGGATCDTAAGSGDGRRRTSFDRFCVSIMCYCYYVLFSSAP